MPVAPASLYLRTAFVGLPSLSMSFVAAFIPYILITTLALLFVRAVLAFRERADDVVVVAHVGVRVDGAQVAGIVDLARVSGRATGARLLGMVMRGRAMQQLMQRDTTRCSVMDKTVRSSVWPGVEGPE